VTRTPAVVLLSVLLAACAATAPVPEDRFYRLDRVHPEQRMGAPVLTGGLALDYVQADPLRGGRAVLYRDSRAPLQLRRYHYEFWVDQPPRMLGRALAAYLRESGVADRVVDADGQGGAAYRLQLRLLKFEQVHNGDGTGVEVAVEATLSLQEGDSRSWTRVYERSRACAGAGMNDTANAMQAAMTDLFAAMKTDLASVVTAGR